MTYPTLQQMRRLASHSLASLAVGGACTTVPSEGTGGKGGTSAAASDRSADVTSTASTSAASPGSSSGNTSSEKTPPKQLLAEWNQQRDP